MGLSGSWRERGTRLRLGELDPQRGQWGGATQRCVALRKGRRSVRREELGIRKAAATAEIKLISDINCTVLLYPIVTA